MPDWGLRHRSPIFDAFPYWKTGCLAIDGDALSSEIMGCHRNSIGFEPDSNRNRIGIESLQKGPLQRIAKDCKGLQSVRWGSFHATLQPRGPRCSFWFGTTCQDVCPAPCGGARSTPRSNRGAPDVVSGLERPAGAWVSSAFARWQP